MSFTRNDLLKIYVPFVDVTGASNGGVPNPVGVTFAVSVIR